MRSHRGTYFTTVFFILLLIPSTPSAVFGTAAAPISTENVGVYLAIAISTRVNIVCK